MHRNVRGQNLVKREARNSLHALGIGCLLALVTLSSAQAAPIYGTDLVGNSDFSGSRSWVGNTPGGMGLTGFINNATPAASVSWSITPLNATQYTYSYTYSHNSAQPGVSHIIIDLTDSCSALGDCFNTAKFGNTAATVEFGTFSGGPGNPLLPSSITGVKLTPNPSISADPFTFSYVSNRVPMWGDLYLKQGNATSNGAAIWNTGNADHTLADKRHFIAVSDNILICADPANCGGPDPGGDVPAPATLSLLAASLIGLGAMRRRRL